MKYYEVITTETSKSFGSKDNYTVFNNTKETYKTLQEAKNELTEKYGSVKKVKCMRDKKDGTSYQSGWIYCFKNSDISHNSKAWLQQDWVEIREINSEIIL